MPTNATEETEKGGRNRNSVISIENVDVVPLPVEVKIEASSAEVGSPKVHPQHGASSELLPTKHPEAVLFGENTLVR